jgi:hypothetical protein
MHSQFHDPKKRKQPAVAELLEDDPSADEMTQGIQMQVIACQSIHALSVAAYQ